MDRRDKCRRRLFASANVEEEQTHSLSFHSSALRDSALAPSTLRTYNKNLLKFLRFADLDEHSFLHIPVSELDRLLSEFIEHLHSVGGSFDYASQALNAVGFRRPAVRLFLGESRLRLRGWARTRHSSSHPPLTWELAVVFAVLMSKWGHHSCAVGLLLSFDCYLRVSELVHLQRADVVMLNDPRMGRAHQGMALRLAKTKTGVNQSVDVRSPAVARLLQFWMQHTEEDARDTDLVFPFSPSRFRKLIRAICSVLDLDDIPYVPHSLRHGGATADYMRGDNIDQIMFRGRWRSMESARRYIQQGKAMLAMRRIPKGLNDLGQSLEPLIVEVLSIMVVQVPSAASIHRHKVRFH